MRSRTDSKLLNRLTLSACAATEGRMPPIEIYPVAVLPGTGKVSDENKGLWNMLRTCTGDKERPNNLRTFRAHNITALHEGFATIVRGLTTVQRAP